MNTKNKPQNIIGLLDPLVMLHYSEWKSNENKVTVAVVDEGTSETHNHPANGSWNWEQAKADCVIGISVAIRAYSADGSCLSSMQGRDICYTDEENNYLDAAAGLKLIKKRLRVFNSARGYVQSPVEEAGRIMEAAGVVDIWYRPDGESNEWLNKGKWNVCSVGDMVRKLGERCPKKEIEETA